MDLGEMASAIKEHSAGCQRAAEGEGGAGRTAAAEGQDVQDAPDESSFDLEVIWADATGRQQQQLLRGIPSSCTLAGLKQRCASALGVAEVWPQDYSEDMDSLQLDQLGIATSGLPFAVSLDPDSMGPLETAAAAAPASSRAGNRAGSASRRSGSTGRRSGSAGRRSGASPGPPKAVPAERQALAEKNALADATDVRGGWLFLGGQQAAGSLAALRKLGVTHVLNCCDRVPCRFPKTLTYKVVHVFDIRSADIRKHFPEALTFIDAAREAGGGCLVHCMVGASRSTSMVLAWLVDRCKVPLKEAFEDVRGRRAVAKPNRAFCEQLMEFEESVLGARSATLADFGHT